MEGLIGDHQRASPASLLVPLDWVEINNHD